MVRNKKAPLKLPLAAGETNLLAASHLIILKEHTVNSPERTGRAAGRCRPTSLSLSEYVPQVNPVVVFCRLGFFGVEEERKLLAGVSEKIRICGLILRV